MTSGPAAAIVVGVDGSLPSLHALDSVRLPTCAVARDGPSTSLRQRRRPSLSDDASERLPGCLCEAMLMSAAPPSGSGGWWPAPPAAVASRTGQGQVCAGRFGAWRR